MRGQVSIGGSYCGNRSRVFGDADIRVCSATIASDDRRIVVDWCDADVERSAADRSGTVVDGKGKAVASGFGVVVLVGDNSSIDVGLSEGRTDGEIDTAAAQHTFGWNTS